MNNERGSVLVIVAVAAISLLIGWTVGAKEAYREGRRDGYQEGYEAGTWDAKRTEPLPHTGIKFAVYEAGRIEL